MHSDFKVPSTIPQDLLLIQDLIGSISPLITTPEKHASDLSDSSDDNSIASTNDGIESEDEVEADLILRDEDGGMSATTSDSDSELDANLSSDSEVHEDEVPQQKKPTDSVEDEDSVITAPSYLQTKNEIVDANIMVPTVSEVELCDTLEKIGEITSIVGNIVIVKGLPLDRVNSPCGGALDVESLLVFEDRKVLGYIYETFGPTSQPLYQVKFNQHYPLDTDKIKLSREVFHVPKRSHFVFVEQLKKMRGSDASNIHDEEPAEDEIEFSDDEKEATFKAQRKRRGRSLSSSRRSTPAQSRIDIDDMAKDAYFGSNPYEAYGPYDDDFHVTGPSRPPPVPYDDPYADIPTADVCVRLVGMNDEFRAEPSSGGDEPRTPRGPVPARGARGRGCRNRESWNIGRRGYRHSPASLRTFDSDAGRSFPPTASRISESATGHGGSLTRGPPLQPASGAWLSPGINDMQIYQQPFLQPHINPRFASIFGLNLPSGSMASWVSQNANNHVPQPQHWVDTWAVHAGAGSENQGDAYRPM